MAYLESSARGVVGDELVRSQRTTDLESGNDIAKAWRLKALATGRYRDVK
jgi:hypothetical protein